MGDDKQNHHEQPTPEVLEEHSDCNGLEDEKLADSETARLLDSSAKTPNAEKNSKWSVKKGLHNMLDKGKEFREAHKMIAEEVCDIVSGSNLTHGNEPAPKIGIVREMVFAPVIAPQLLGFMVKDSVQRRLHPKEQDSQK
ncbi:hypothetical protein NOR_04629 [Metarhizium rileyi]|uniref:Uncharacterized protein n=1 Tax=Metarhizium rileyi (strain RCEF 4871) TaxID=1649241 RepID=A0A167E418_METRR|nr:hypothetical protein NOR_04629 [Metarhizium rileyi RCEF 4871]